MARYSILDVSFCKLLDQPNTASPASSKQCSAKLSMSFAVSHDPMLIANTSAMIDRQDEYIFFGELLLLLVLCVCCLDCLLRACRRCGSWRYCSSNGDELQPPASNLATARRCWSRSGRVSFFFLRNDIYVSAFRYIYEKGTTDSRKK